MAHSESMAVVSSLKICSRLWISGPGVAWELGWCPPEPAGQELTKCKTEGRPGLGSWGIRPLPDARVGRVEGGSLSFSMPRLERASAFCARYLLVTWSLQARPPGCESWAGRPLAGSSKEAAKHRPSPTVSWVALQLRGRHELC